MKSSAWHHGELLARRVHVWQISLNSLQGSLDESREILSVDEKRRARRFRFERDRQKFTLTHWAVRLILGKYMDCDPRHLTFELGAKGKPQIRRSENLSGLHFNLSHSGDFAVLALTSRLSLGIDVEAVTSAFATEEIANSFFSPDEVSCLMALPLERRAEGFFCCWTRKEAYIKAKGGGLYIPLDSFSVTVHPDKRPMLLRAVNGVNEINRWSFYNLRIHPAYRAALVAEGRNHEIFQFNFVPAQAHWFEETMTTLDCYKVVADLFE
jgi:4'-phosphopantetheinyl transferase